MAPLNQSGAGKVLDTIVGQSPEGIALLFKKYGITAPVGSQTLQSALIVHKRPFADDLYNVVLSKGMSSADGATEQKDKFADILNQVLGAATGIYTILQPGQTTTQEDPAKKEENKPAPKQIFGIPVAFVIGIGVIILLVITLLLIRKKS